MLQPAPIFMSELRMYMRNVSTLLSQACRFTFPQTMLRKCMYASNIKRSPQDLIPGPNRVSLESHNMSLLLGTPTRLVQALCFTVASTDNTYSGISNNLRTNVGTAVTLAVTDSSSVRCLDLPTETESEARGALCPHRGDILTASTWNSPCRRVDWFDGAHHTAANTHG